jgi:S-adenosylmethionine hydrolase
LRQIAILTDFGISDNYNGVMEAVIRRINPEVTITYITPNARNFDVISGAYLLFTSYRYFPKGTIFLVVIDPGVGTSRKPLIVRTNNYLFVGPDNGVLYPAIYDDGVKKVVAISNKRLYLSKQVSHTFHGRDIFSVASAFLSLGVDMSTFGEEVDPNSLVRLEFKQEDRGNFVCGTVVYVDHFGNVATSIRKEVRGVKSVSVRDRKFSAKRVNTFGEGRPGELLVYTNSYGFLEIGINKGSASQFTGAETGDEVCVELYTQEDSSRSI